MIQLLSLEGSDRYQSSTPCALSDFFGARERAFAFERKITQKLLYSEQKNVTVHGKTHLNPYSLNG